MSLAVGHVINNILLSSACMRYKFRVAESVIVLCHGDIPFVLQWNHRGKWAATKEIWLLVQASVSCDNPCSFPSDVPSDVPSVHTSSCSAGPVVLLVDCPVPIQAVIHVTYHFIGHLECRRDGLFHSISLFLLSFIFFLHMIVLHTYIYTLSTFAYFYL